MASMLVRRLEVNINAGAIHSIILTKLIDYLTEKILNVNASLLEHANIHRRDNIY